MKCKNCGSEIKAGSAFCANCGTSVEQVVNQAQPIPQSVPGGQYYYAPQQPKNGGFFKIFGIIMLVLLILGGLGVGGYFGYKALTKDKEETKEKEKDKEKEENKNILQCSANSDDEDLKMKASMKVYFDKNTKKYDHQDMNFEITLNSIEEAKGALEDKEAVCTMFSLGGDCEVTRDGKILKINVRNGVSTTYQEMTREELKKELEEDELTKCN